MGYDVSSYGNTDVGLVRQNNEDFWVLMPEEHFFVLADGMGGHRGGEVASREMSESLCSQFKEKLVGASNKDIQTISQLILESICESNQVVYRMGKQFSELKGMGTTLCCLYVHSDGLICGHVGDSRIYRLRKGKLERLTKDDSLLRELIDLGQVSEQQSDQFVYKNILTKAVGTEPFIEPTVTIESIESDDLLMMCSDGLTDMLSDQMIGNILVKVSPKEAASVLVKAAVEKGGYDNVTVVIVKVNGKNES